MPKQAGVTKQVAAQSRSTARSKRRLPPASKKPVTTADNGSRILPPPQRHLRQPRSWFNRPPVPAYRPLPKARKIFWQGVRQLWTERKVFGGIVVLYGVLTILLVRGLAGSSDLTTLKSALDSVASGAGGKLASTAGTFVYLLGNSGSSNSATSGVYQSCLLTTCSLAFIWTLRQVQAKRSVRVRDGFYEGMYPLVPFLLVFLIIGLQLVPLLLGGALYSSVVSGGIAITVLEKVLFGLVFAALAIWSLRMLSASIFAAYIVTLPNMTPLRALRSAKQLVYGRRLLIWRKLIFLPIALLLVAAAVELPLILFVTPLAEWAFFALSMAALAVVHSYLYGLYRELL